MILALCYIMPRTLYPSFRCGTVLYNVNKYNFLFCPYYSLWSRICHMYGVWAETSWSLTLLEYKLGLILYGLELFFAFYFFHFRFTLLCAHRAKPVFCWKVGQTQQSFILLLGYGLSHVTCRPVFLSYFHHLQYWYLGLKFCLFRKDLWGKVRISLS